MNNTEYTRMSEQITAAHTLIDQQQSIIAMLIDAIKNDSYSEDWKKLTILRAEKAVRLFNQNRGTGTV